MSTEHRGEQPAGGAQKYVYFFGGGKADGNGKMKDVLGGKGSSLAEMTKAGLHPNGPAWLSRVAS